MIPHSLTVFDSKRSADNNYARMMGTKQDSLSKPGCVYTTFRAKIPSRLTITSAFTFSSPVLLVINSKKTFCSHRWIGTILATTYQMQSSTRCPHFSQLLNRIWNTLFIWLPGYHTVGATHLPAWVFISSTCVCWDTSWGCSPVFSLSSLFSS